MLLVLQIHHAIRTYFSCWMVLALTDWMEGMFVLTLSFWDRTKLIDSPRDSTLDAFRIRQEAKLHETILGVSLFKPAFIAIRQGTAYKATILIKNCIEAVSPMPC